MRVSALAGSLALLGIACAHTPPLRPALASQTDRHDPRSAQVEVSGVRLTVRAADWRGYPDDLEDYLTPVEVLVENDSGRALRIRPRNFSLIGPDGYRFDAIPPQEIRRILGPYEQWRASTYAYYGLYGVYPWPAFSLGFGPGYPYLWRDDTYLWAPPPSPEVPPGATEPRPTPPGTLENRGHASVLLFYPVPANRLPSATVAILVVDTKGQSLGRVRVPFVRGEPAKPAAPPPAGAEGPSSASPGAPPPPSGPSPGPPPPANTPPEK